jgi:hypothetical protein
VSMIVLLLPARGRRVDLGPDSVGALAELGIRHAGFLQDDLDIAVVLEGGTFDPETSARLAADLIAGPEAVPRLLRPVAELALQRQSPIERRST